MDATALRLIYASAYLVTALMIFSQLKNSRDRNLLFVFACTFLSMYWLIVSIRLILPAYTELLHPVSRVAYHIGLFTFVWASILRNHSPKWLAALALIDLLIYFIGWFEIGLSLPFPYYVASSQAIIAASFFMRLQKRNFADKTLVFLFSVSSFMVLFHAPLNEYSPLINLSMIALVNVSVCFALIGSSLLDYKFEIAKLINSDTISNLPNRRALFKTLNQKDNESEPYHLLIVEWIGLKEITNDFGYTITDKTLSILSARAQQLALPLHWYNLSLTQWVILFDGNEDQVDTIAEQVTVLVRQAFTIEQYEVRLKPNLVLHLPV